MHDTDQGNKVIAVEERRDQSARSAPGRSSATPLIAIRNRLLSFPSVLACSLTYLVFVLSRRDIADPDLWWHLRNSQYLLTKWHLSLVDSYSFTAPGAAVLPFEWLAEIPYYLAYRWGGLSAVFVLVFVVSSAIVLCVFRLSYLASHDVKNSFVVSITGAVMAAISIGARTLLFGWLYLVVLLLILESVRRGGFKWLWTVPPLFCLWVNSHGSWPMGVVVFGIFIASGLFEGRWGNLYATRWSGSQLRGLLVTAGASGLALFVNPIGYRLVFYPFRVMFGANSGVGMIQEFTSIDFQTPWGKVAIVLIIGTLLIAVLSSELWRLDELALMIVALTYSLTYIRFMFLAGILAPPIFARRLKLMTPYRRDSDKLRNNAVALFVLLCLFIATAPRHSRFKNPVKYPDGAVAYMKENGVQGRLFHEWTWGGYLIWHTPEFKVFIDGRGDPYVPTGVFKDYLAASSCENSQAVFDKYQIEYVLIAAGSPLSESLKTSPKWTVQYSDATSILFHRSPA
jgi:hypothetical protein